MTEPGAKKAQPRRLWLLVVVLALAAAGISYSLYRRGSAPAEVVVTGGGRPQLFDFGMGVCTQCKRMKPVMERAARELGDYAEVYVLDIRIEVNEQLAERYGMHAIPFILLVDGAGKEIWRHEGFVDYPELSQAVQERLDARGGVCAPEKEVCNP